jgi:hypothetical protein
MFILGKQPGILEKLPLNNFFTVQWISTSSIPIDSAWQVEKRGTSKMFHILFQGAVGEFSKKILPFNKLLTVQWISTSNIPINSAWQVAK